MLLVRMEHDSVRRRPDPRSAICDPIRNPRLVISDSGIRDSRSRLFGSQGDHGVHARRASCGDVAGDERDQGEQHAGRHERDWILPAQAKKQALEKLRADSGDRQPECRADGGQRKALPDDQANDVALVGAERHANADLARALSDGVQRDPRFRPRTTAGRRSPACRRRRRRCAAESDQTR